jgi:hypothetical protein
MHMLSLADELAEIRAEISRLKLREAALRDRILAAPQATWVGRWHRVEVTDHLVRRFDMSLLPTAIREDPAFWRETVQTRVATMALTGRTARPGWPIRRGEGRAAVH